MSIHDPTLAAQAAAGVTQQPYKQRKDHHLDIQALADAVGISPRSMRVRVRKGADLEAPRYAQRALCKVPRTPEVRELLEAAIAAGERNTVIAEKLEIHPNSLVKLGDAFDLELRFREIPQKPLSVRDVVQDMKPLEAVEYLLELIEQSMGQDDALMEEVVRFKLTPMQAVLFGLLRKHLGHTVVRERLQSAGDAVRSEPKGEKLLDVFICQIRKKLAGVYRIDTIWGHGYRMELA